MTRKFFKEGTSGGGFTFIEVLVAMLIFTLAALAAVDIGRGSVRATREAKTITTATWLLQGVMTDLEDRLESEGVDKGCEKKKDGKFPAPHDNFTWVQECYQIDFKISETAAKLSAAMNNKEQDESQKDQQDAITKMIMDTASKYITDSMRELHAEVIWKEGKQTRHVDVTTHFARYDQQVNIPGLNGLGAGQ